MGILHTFGLEASLFLFQIINFLVILFILTKFLYKPIRNMVEERKRKIDQSLRDAEDAKAALENAGAERKRILGDAKKDADIMTAATKRQLSETKEKLTKEAKERSQQIIDEAKQRAVVELENVNKQVGRMSVDLSGKIMTKLFSDLFTDEDKQKILSRALEKIEKGGYETGSN
ncbi:MAG: F0F1 ATP synthase subunit B [Elusimicrobiota bacterium]|jgi:F-type H+-transporting ATPase subunit b|nr:F0F1 ATP synthase subunit B [Elusimicrobiota bacterium]